MPVLIEVASKLCEVLKYYLKDEVGAHMGIHEKYKIYIINNYIYIERLFDSSFRTIRTFVNAEIPLAIQKILNINKQL